MDKGFIVERGFKKLIPPFSEMLQNRGWPSLGMHKVLDCVALVKEFFLTWWKMKEIRYMLEENG